MKYVLAALAGVCALILIIGIGSNASESVVAGLGIAFAAGAAVT